MDGEMAFAVCPAAESGWIAWFGQGDPNIVEFTKKAYVNGFPCPYGKPGDRLWVRETWLPRNNGTRFFYRADLDPVEAAGISGMYSDKGWRPSIFMPRWASRITLEIVSVRVERLQDISEEDAKAEGVTGGYQGWNIPEDRHQWHHPHRASYSALWDSINGKKHPWESNPFCWVIEFRRIEA